MRRSRKLRLSAGGTSEPVDGVWLVKESNQKGLLEHLADYFGQTSRGRARAAEQYFECFIGISALKPFTAFDRLTAESLSVDAPSDVAHWLVRPDPDHDDPLRKCLRDYNN